MDAVGILLQVGFKTFLNITPSITHLSAPLPGSSTASTPQRSSNPPAASSGPGSAFVLTLEENPLAEFVELPEEALDSGLWYSNVLCGVLKGALEMVSLIHSRSSCFRRWNGPSRTKTLSPGIWGQSLFHSIADYCFESCR